ncbi:DUF6297 family protein [Actinocorallia populi]|uniref:DUF6297 family protein n=1 Tax=Actinocorallia populi TaxID=2079200 RepID=UPI000D0894E8|nr:DUF6297 family protein [Actinocorallia populi]
MTEAVAEPAVREVLRLVRRARPARNRGDLAYQVYFGVLAVLLVVPPVVVAVRDALRKPASLPDLPAQVLDVLPLGLVAMALIALWAALQDAVWRGPVRVSVAFIDWVLPLPLAREAVLRPFLLRAAGLSAVLWAAGCLVLPLLLWQTVLPMPDEAGPLLVQTVAAGALLGLFGSFAGTLLGDGRILDGLRPFFHLALFLLAGLAGLIWTGRVPADAAEPVLWSGPWGWAGLLLLDRHRLPALALLAALALAAAVAGTRRLPSLDPHGLRSGAQLASGVRAGLWLTEGGWFRASLDNARRADFSPRTALRPPRNPRLLVPWRDLLSILRDGAALVRAFLLLGAALLCIRAEPGALPLSLRVLIDVAGPLCMYLAVGGLLGGARASASSPDRARYFLHSPGGLALAHGVTPLLVAAVPALAWGGALTLLGGPDPGVLWALACLPASAAAALAGTYRGTMPLQVMSGFETPFGNSALLQMGLWHASGFLGLLAVTWPGNVPWLLAGTAALGWWARHRGSRIMGADGP